MNSMDLMAMSSFDDVRVHSGAFPARATSLVNHAPIFLPPATDDHRTLHDTNGAPQCLFSRS
jgi:hypothetical protein